MMIGYELVHLEQGDRAAIYELWPSLFPVAKGSLRFSMAMNRFLSELHNAIGEANRRYRKERG